MHNWHLDVPLCQRTGLCSCHGRHLTLLEVAQGHEQIGGALYSLDVRTGEAELLLDNWNGLRFNSPNDLVVRTASLASPHLPLLLCGMLMSLGELSKGPLMRGVELPCLLAMS